jgi:hypothetical protein
MTEFRRTYTLVDMAERLGRPRTTLADWARQFREFLPTVGSGRTMRYNEAALEVFGLISKMKDANEPPEYIREQLRGVVTEIIVPMTDDDEGKPYLMQLAGEVDQLKQAVVMLAQQMEALTTVNDDTRRQVASTTEQLSERIADVQTSLGDEIRKGQEQTRAQLGEILSRVDTYGKRKRWWPFG